MTEGELKKRIERNLRYAATNGSIDVNLDGVIQHSIESVLDEAVKEFPKLTVIAGIPMYEEFYLDIGKWITKWLGKPTVGECKECAAE